MNSRRFPPADRLGLLLGVLLAASPAAAARPGSNNAPLNLDLDDRNDPVRPGEHVVYELELENRTNRVARGVVVTDVLPPGTTFVGARREPDWAEVPAVVREGEGEVDLLVGEVVPCDRPGSTPRCRDVWIVLRVDDAAAPGARIGNRVRSATDDPATFPTNEAATITTIGSAGIRAALARTDSARGGVALQADLARDGIASRADPPTPDIDLAGGLRLRVGPPGGTPWIDATLGPADLRCTNPGRDPRRHTSCRPRDLRAAAERGIGSLEVGLRPAYAAQRINAQVRVRTTPVFLDSTGGVAVEFRLEAGGAVFEDSARLVEETPGRWRYHRTQGDP